MKDCWACSRPVSDSRAILQKCVEVRVEVFDEVIIQILSYLLRRCRFRSTMWYEGVITFFSFNSNPPPLLDGIFYCNVVQDEVELLLPGLLELHSVTTDTTAVIKEIRYSLLEFFFNGAGNIN